MPTIAAPRNWVKFSHIWSRVLSAGAGAIGVVELYAWIVRPGWVSAGMYYMKANAALVVVLVTAAVLLRVGAGPGWRRALSSLLAVAGLLITVPTLVEYLTAWSPGLDALFGSDPTPDGGRMAAQTAGVMSLLAIALLAYEHDGDAGALLCDGALVAAALVLQVMFTGYFDGASLLFDAAGRATAAPQSGIAQLLACGGLAFGRVGRGAFRLFARDNMGSAALRMIVPAIVLLPVVLGRARQQAEHMGWIQPSYGHALFSVAQTAILGLTVYAFARHVNRLDEQYRAERKRREEVERYVAMCAWTRRIRLDGHWVSIEEFLQRRFGLEVTHGISDEALADQLATLDLRDDLRREGTAERE